MPGRLPLDDFFCKVFGLGQIVKWEEERQRARACHELVRREGRLLPLSAMPYNQIVPRREQRRTHDGRVLGSTEHHSQEARYHLQRLGHNWDTIRQLGLQPRIDELLQGLPYDVRRWKRSTLERFVDLNESDIMECRKANQYEDGGLSTLLPPNAMRRLVQYYIDETADHEAATRHQDGIYRDGYGHYAPKRLRSPHHGNRLMSPAFERDRYYDQDLYYDDDEDLQRRYNRQRKHRPRHHRHDDDDDYDARVPLPGHYRRQDDEDRGYETL